jgi:hypothetical protein
MFLRKVIIKVDDVELKDFKITFEVEKYLHGTPNKANVKIWNLKKSSRDQIEEKGKKVEILAGYEDTETGLVYSGDIVNVVHTKTQTEWVTEILSGDGIDILGGSIVNQTMAAGSSMNQVYDALVARLPGISKGVTKGIKNCLSGKKSLLRSLQLTGDVKSWLDQIAKDCGFEYSVNENIIETNPTGQPLSDLPPIQVNQAKGMKNSPKKTEKGVNVKTILNPNLKLARTIDITDTGKEIPKGTGSFEEVPGTIDQGVYRIVKIVHRGSTHENTWESEIESDTF